MTCCNVCVPQAKAPQHWDLRCPGNSVHSTSLWLSGRLSLWPSAIDMHSAESCVASWKGAPAGYTKFQMHRCCTARTVCVHTNQPLHTVNQATEGTCSKPSCTRCICKQWDAVTSATLYPDRQCGTPTCTVKTHCTPNKKKATTLIICRHNSHQNCMSMGGKCRSLSFMAIDSRSPSPRSEVLPGFSSSSGFLISMPAGRHTTCQHTHVSSACSIRRQTAYASFIICHWQ